MDITRIDNILYYRMFIEYCDFSKIIKCELWPFSFFPRCQRVCTADFTLGPPPEGRSDTGAAAELSEFRKIIL